jgi:lipopolysaccharide export system permease protein
MHRITRYVLTELLKVFVFSLAVLTTVVLLGLVAVEAFREGLGLSAVSQLLPYSLPMALRFTVPGTILFAACTVFGRMSSANEIVAIKSLGISPMVVVWPALMLAAFLSGIAVWLNDVAVSWGTAGINRVVLQSLEQIVYGRLKTQRSYSNNRGLAFHVRDVQGKKLIMPMLSYQPQDGSSPIVITAEEAELMLNKDSSALVIVFTNMVVDGDKQNGIWPGRFEHEIPLSMASRRSREFKSPSDLPMGDIPRAIGDSRLRIEQLEQEMAADAAYQLATGDFQSLTDPQWEVRRQQVSDERSRLNRLLTEPWRRWATGFSCFCFVLVGVPLAILLRNSDYVTIFAGCFLPILFTYYPMFMVAVDRAKSGAMPPYSVWIGNLVLIGVGLLLLRPVRKH